MFGQMLNAFLKSQKIKNFEIIINKRWKKRQPDLLILKDNMPTCVIEIKTDLGYSRTQWLKVMINRLEAYHERGIRKENFYLIVLTASNWLSNKMSLNQEIEKWEKRIALVSG